MKYISVLLFLKNAVQMASAWAGGIFINFTALCLNYVQ